jgi:hypothetical protein
MFASYARSLPYCKVLHLGRLLPSLHAWNNTIDFAVVPATEKKDVYDINLKVSISLPLSARC